MQPSASGFRRSWAMRTRAATRKVDSRRVARVSIATQRRLARASSRGGCGSAREQQCGGEDGDEGHTHPAAPAAGGAFSTAAWGEEPGGAHSNGPRSVAGAPARHELREWTHVALSLPFGALACGLQGCEVTATKGWTTTSPHGGDQGSATLARHP